MTKQYFSTLFKRVDVGSFIGMAIALLLIACPSSSDSNDDGPSNLVPAALSPPTLSNVTPEANRTGAVTIDFKESTDLLFKHTLITASGISNGDTHTVTATVPRGSDGSVIMNGLKPGYRYTFTLQAVSQSGVVSKVSDASREEVEPTDIPEISTADRQARMNNFLKVQNDANNADENDANKIALKTADMLNIAPKLDKDTKEDVVKVHFDTISSLYGITKIDVLAVDADANTPTEESIEALSKNKEKSVLVTKNKPKGREDVTLKALKVGTSDANQGKVKLFYRLHDVNYQSRWMSVGDPVAPVAVIEDITDLKVVGGNESITSITWKGVVRYKTFIKVVNTNTGRVVGKALFNAGVTNAAAKIGKGELIALKGKLYGTGNYTVTAKAVKDGIYTKGVTYNVTVKDTTPPSGNHANGTPITLALTNIGGGIVKASINEQPFEQDYAGTILTLLKKEGSKKIPYKNISRVLNKGTLSAQFTVENAATYVVGALFFDIAGNTSKPPSGKLGVIESAEVQVTLDNLNKPKAVQVVIENYPAATVSTKIDGKVTVTWKLNEATALKHDQVKNWKVTALQYDDSAADTTATPWKSKDITGERRDLSLNTYSVTFLKLQLGKHYTFKVEGTDQFDNRIVGVTSDTRQEVKERIPADIETGNSGALVIKKAGAKGTLQFKKGNSFAAGKSTDRIAVTIKKDGKVVSGFNKRKYRESDDNRDIKPPYGFSAGTYKVELQAYSTILHKYSTSVKKLEDITVESGVAAPTHKIAKNDMTNASTKNTFTVTVNWNKNNAGNTILGQPYSAVFGTDHAGAGLRDAKFELYYAKHGDEVEADDVTITKTITAANLLKAFNAKKSNAKEAGKIDIENHETLEKGVLVKDLEAGKKYQYFIRTVNNLNSEEFIDSETQEVKLNSPPKLKGPPTVTAVTNKNQLKVRIAASEEFGKAHDDGISLNSSKVTYYFYYARAGYRESGTTVSEMTTAEQIRGFDYTTTATNKDRGKVALTAGNSNGVGADSSADKLVDNLQDLEKYYWFVRVEETAAHLNGSNSAVGSTTTKSGSAAATGTIPVITPVTGAAVVGTIKVTLNRIVGGGSGAEAFGKKPDGTAATGNEVVYWLYYSKTGVSNTKDKIVQEVERKNNPVATANVDASINVSDVTSGVFVLDNPANSAIYTLAKLIPNTNYRFFVRQIRTTDPGYDSTKSQSGALGRDSQLSGEVKSKSAEKELADLAFYTARTERNYLKAIQQCTESIKIKPNAYAYKIRGDIYIMLKQNDNAIADFTKAIQLDAKDNYPKDPITYYNRGYAKDNKKNYDDALEDYTIAIELLKPKADNAAYPWNTKAKEIIANIYNAKGYTYLEKKDYAKAIENFSSAISNNPNNYRAYLNRGIAKSKLETAQDPKSDYGKAMEIHTSYYKAPMLLGYYYLNNWTSKGANFVEAEKQFTNAIAINNRDYAAWVNRGIARRKQGKYDEAIFDFTEAIRLNNKAAIAYAQRGKAKNLKSKGTDAGAADIAKAQTLLGS